VFGGGHDVDVFVRGQDGGLWEIVYDDARGWSSWFEIPATNGALASAPATVVTAGGTEFDVFYAGTDGGLWETSYTGVNGWHPPVEIPGTAGTLGSAPTAALYGGALDVFYLSRNSGLLQATLTASGWHGPSVPANPAVSTTPVPTTISPPVPAPHTRPRVRVRLTFSWTWSHRGTHMRHARAAGFPAQATITVRCTGRGCPKRPDTAKRRGLGRLWHVLERRVFRPGQRLTIAITERGHLPERVRVRIRSGAIPVARLL
jgi:hypothetical protein